jgi:2'-5' RNA ligase
MPLTGNKPRQQSPRNDGNRPDHFVAVRVNSPQLNQLRHSIVTKTPEIKAYMEEPHNSHVTIGVVRLDTESKVNECTASFQRAADALRKRELFRETGGAFNMSFDAFDMFDTRVLYLKPTRDCAVLFDKLRECFFEEGVLADFDADTRRREYRPHLTIAKKTRWIAKHRRVLGQAQMPTDPSIYDGIKVDIYASTLTIELLKMRGEKEADGYYKIISSQYLDEYGESTSEGKEGSIRGERR